MNIRSSGISVLLAVYNGGLWLNSAISSVRDQSLADWELIIVDNGSTDGSFEVAEAAAFLDPRIRVFRLNERGKNRAYNFAFDRSAKAFVTYFAADDILPPNSLERRRAPLLDGTANVFSTAAMRTISADPKFDGLLMPRDVTRPNFSGGVLMFSRDLAERVFPLPLDLPNEDTWTQLHLRAFGTHRHCPAALYEYRIHGANSFGYSADYTAKKDGFLRRMRAYDMFLERYRTAEPGNSFVQDHVALFVEAVAALRNGRPMPVLLSRKFPLTMKALIAYYSSPLLFRLRALLFRLLSGRMIQT